LLTIAYDEDMAVIDDIKTILGNTQDSQHTKTEALGKVLIVEDEPILREMYQDKFVHEGFVVVTAENGKVGLEKTLSEKPDVIILDLMMPVMDGKVMLQKLREYPEFKKLPVMILTNAGEVENIRETQRYDNAREFLIKSNVTVDEVVKRTKFWLPTAKIK